MASGHRGLSIVELLAVVTILGILAAIVTPVAQVVITREVELDLMRHLRGVRRGIDSYHEIAVKCWDNTCRTNGLHTVNRKDQERCRQCSQLLAGVKCMNCGNWNSRSMRDCQWCLAQVPPVTVSLGNIRCPNVSCANLVPAVDTQTGRFVNRCPICDTSLILYHEHSWTNYPTSFQDMYMLNTLRLSHSYNPVTAGREDWDVTLFRPPGSRTMDLRVNAIDILTYDPTTGIAGGIVIDGYPRQEGTNGLLRQGNGYILESREWKTLMTNGQLDINKWIAWCGQHLISVYDLGSDSWQTFAQIQTAYPNAFAGVSGTGSGTGAAPGQIFLPQIYDVHFPVLSTRNRKTLDGKKIYSDL